MVKVAMWSRGLTWRSQVGANPIPIPYRTNLALFGHKITLYRFNQGAHTIAGEAETGAGGWAPPPWPPLFNHCQHPVDEVVAYRSVSIYQRHWKTYILWCAFLLNQLLYGQMPLLTPTIRCQSLGGWALFFSRPLRLLNVKGRHCLSRRPSDVTTIR